MTVEGRVISAVVGVLEDLGVPYMLTGSVASSYHGRPRATHDADIVIDPSPDQLDALVRRLVDEGFYVSPEGAREAYRGRRPFNVIETRHACKIDLIIRRDRAFSRDEFARRVFVDLPFRSGVAMVSPEDALLSKLEWARRAGDSERQIADAAGILAVCRSIDRAYVERWARELGVTDLWHRIAGTASATP